MSVPISDLVLKGITVKGSIVGTRNDLAGARPSLSSGLRLCDLFAKTSR